MNPGDPLTIVRAAAKSLAALLLASALLGWAARNSYRRARGGDLQLVGAFGLMIVAVAHVCEALRLLPFMGWGRPDSIGHYLDLSGAIVGVSALIAAYVIRRRRA